MKRSKKNTRREKGAMKKSKKKGKSATKMTLIVGVKTKTVI